MDGLEGAIINENNSMLTGLTENQSDLYKEFKQYKDSMTEGMTELFENVKNIAKYLSVKSAAADASKQAESSFIPEDFLSSEGKEESKAEDFEVASGSEKVDDLKGLDKRFVGGSIALINYLNTEFLKSLKEIVGKSVGGTKADKPKKEAGKSGGLSIMGLDNLTGNFKAMAESLQVFAKGMIILSLIPKKAASAGMELFVTFIDNYISVSEELQGKEKNFELLTESLATLSKSLMLFSGAAVIMSLTLPFMAISLLFMSLLGVFLQMSQAAFENIDKVIKAYKDFAVASLILAVAFAAFAGALFVLALVKPYLPDAVPALLISVGIIAAAVTVSILATSAISAFVSFAVASLLLAVAFAAFGGAIFILSKIEVDWGNLIQSLLAAGIMIVAAAALGYAMMAAIPAMIAMAAVSVLMAVGFGLFALGLLALKAVSTFDIGEMMIGMTNVTLVATGMALLTPIMLVAMVSAALLTVFATLSAAGFAMMSLTLLSMRLVAAVSNEEVKNGFTVMTSLALGMSALVLPITVGTVAAALLLPFALLAAASFASLALTVSAIKEISTKAKDLGDISDSLNLVRNSVIDAIYIMLGVSPGAGALAIAAATVKIAGLILVVNTLKGFVRPAADLFVSFVSIIDSIRTLKENMDTLDGETITSIFGIISGLLQEMGNSATAFKDTSSETIAAMGSLVLDVSLAIGTLTDVVVKLNDGIPEEQITAATDAIKSIVKKLFGTGEADEGYTLTTLFTTLAKSDIKDLSAESVSAINPIIDSISNIADLVVRIGDKDSFNVQTFTNGSFAISQSATLISELAELATFLCKKQGKFLGMFGGISPAEAFSDLSEAGTIQSIETFLNDIAGLPQTVTSIQSPLETISSLRTFFSQDWSGFSANIIAFKTGTNNLAKALDNLSQEALNKFEHLIKIISSADSEFIKGIDNLGKLADKAQGFKLVANSFESIADSVERIGKNAKKAGSFFEKLFDKEGKASQLANSTAAAINTGFDPNVELMATILTDWSANGVPIRATFNASNGEIVPDNVGQAVGQGQSR
jgi:hypothetical protein